jgi:UDP-MurNAc hydroxylase
VFELTYIGHAGWLIKNKDFKILCDPWFGPQGAYFGQWFPFPRNSQMNTKELTTDLDFIYISHAHDDHFDEWFLSQIDKTIPIFIPKFSDEVLKNRLLHLGFCAVIEFTSKADITIRGVNIRIIEDDGYMDKDSCILLDDGNHKILNLNDCHLDFSSLREIVGEIDVLLLQSSTAIWWPCVYNYDISEMIERCALKRKNILKRTLKYAQELDAALTIPNAGPPYLLDDKLDVWNTTRRESYNPFVLGDEAVKYLQDNAVDSALVIPGSRIQCDTMGFKYKTDTDQVKEIYDNYKNYIEKYNKYLKGYCEKEYKVDDIDVQKVPNLFDKHIKQIQSHSKIYTQILDFPILFDFKEAGKWIVDFSKKQCFVKYTDQKYGYKFIFEPKYVWILLQEKYIDFDKYLLGMNFECSREPDDYNEIIFTLLKNFDLKRLLQSEKIYLDRNNLLNKTFTLHHNEKTYKVQKYCPHMFADLEKCGYIDKEENFVCPLHGWRFDMKTGECLSNRNCSLKIEEQNG